MTLGLLYCILGWNLVLLLSSVLASRYSLLIQLYPESLFLFIIIYIIIIIIIYIRIIINIVIIIIDNIIEIVST